MTQDEIAILVIGRTIYISASKLYYAILKVTLLQVLTSAAYVMFRK